MLSCSQLIMNGKENNCYVIFIFIHNHYEVHFSLLNVTKNYVSNRTDFSKILRGNFVAGKLECFW